MSAITPAFRVEKIGDATLILGDCRAVIPTLQDIACVLTDPPFGISYQSGHRTDALWSEDAIRGDEDISVRDAALALLPKDVPILAFGSRKAPLPPGC